MRVDDERERATRETSGALAGVMLAVCLALALAGCSVGPKYVKPVATINPDWSQQGQAGVVNATPPDSAWWRGFNDPALDRLVQMAYHQNLSLQVAGLRIMEARARLGIVSGQQWPQVGVGFGSATTVGLSQKAPNSALTDRYFWDFQVGFDAAWELDFWGKYRGNERTEVARFYAAIADYDDALVSLSAEVARTYALIRTYEVLLAQARENVKLQEEGLRIAQARFKHGATSELDVAQSTTLLESTRTTIPNLEIVLKQAQNALCTLLGQPVGSLDAILAGGTDIPNAPADAMVSVPAELLRRRPDIRSVEYSAIAQCAQIGVAEADLYPRFSLFGSIGTHSSENGGVLAGNAKFKDLFSAGSGYYSLGPSISLPIFNRGRIKNNARMQDARFQQLIVEYQNTVLKAAQEVEDGLTGFAKSKEALESAQKAADGAQRAVDLAFIQYREGAVDFQRVLDAQRSLLSEQNTLARTRGAIATDWIAVYKALGGGWEIRRGQPFVPDSTRVEMQHRTNWGNLFTNSPAPPTTHGDTQDQR